MEMEVEIEIWMVGIRGVVERKGREEDKVR